MDDLVGDVDPLLLAGEVDHQPGADVDRQPRHVEAERDDEIASQPARIDHHHTERADPQQRRGSRVEIGPDADIDRCEELEALVGDIEIEHPRHRRDRTIAPDRERAGDRHVDEEAGVVEDDRMGRIACVDLIAGRRIPLGGETRGEVDLRLPMRPEAHVHLHRQGRTGTEEIVDRPNRLDRVDREIHGEIGGRIGQRHRGPDKDADVEIVEGKALGVGIHLSRKRFPGAVAVENLVVVTVKEVGAAPADEAIDVRGPDRHRRDAIGGLAAAAGEFDILLRPQFEGERADERDDAEGVDVEEALRADQRRIHVEVDRLAAGIDLVAERIDAAVTVDVGRLGLGKNGGGGGSNAAEEPGCLERTDSACIGI